jgi:hypothetical protein
MHLIHGTIMTTNVAQPIIPAAVVPDRLGPFQLLLPQNNGSNNMRFGDASITSTSGLILYPSATTNPGITPIYPSLAYSGDLTEFNILGTAGDHYDILILD